MMNAKLGMLLHLFKGGLKLDAMWFEPQGESSQRDRSLGACQRPTLVLLHEGLGCVAMWRQFPQVLADATQSRVFAYSRQGYGSSTPIAAPRLLDFMLDEAQRVLPAVLDAAGIEKPILIGHSDGASIALLAAAQVPNIQAIVAIAPHLFVEDISVASIKEAHTAFQNETTGLRDKLAKYHADVDGAFYGWANAWLDVQFRQWSITQQMSAITCPVLAIQGEQDQYGTMAQLDTLKAMATQTELLKLNDCKHSPQFDQAALVIAAIARFVSTVAK